MQRNMITHDMLYRSLKKQTYRLPSRQSTLQPSEPY